MNANRLVCAMLAWAALTAMPAAAVRAETTVDLELVLAVDVSLSMDLEEQRLQREGYVAAFRDPEVIRAIRSGLHGRIAVTYLEWAGARTQSVVVPWRVLADERDAHAFADLLAKAPIDQARMTSISAALTMSAALFETNRVRGLRRTIDVSGDGPNNAGQPVESVRDAVVKHGIAINGLALLLHAQSDHFSYFEIPELDRYYRDCVIGGPASFALAVRAKSEFAKAIRQKLLLEIAGVPAATAPRIVRAQLAAPREKYDCLIGEKLWQQFLNDGHGD